jgi:hypothetical protein
MNTIISEISRQCGEPNLPQQIYEACLNKQAFLFVRDGAGWVLKSVVGNGMQGVLVWAAWSEKQNGLLEHTEEVIALARKINAEFLRFHTVRKGFLRVGARYGWVFSGFDEQRRK